MWGHSRHKTKPLRRSNSRVIGLAARLLFVIFIVSTRFAGQPAQHATAREVVARIQQHSNVPCTGDTVDTFKAGDPDTSVTGIAVAMMATFEVLKRAAAIDANLIITHEPTFYGHLDKTEAFEAANDPIWRAKKSSSPTIISSYGGFMTTGT